MSDEWKGLVALFGAFAAGMTLIMFLSGFVGLPQKVLAQDTRLTHVEEAISKLDTLTCIMLNKEFGRPVEDCVE